MSIPDNCSDAPRKRERTLEGILVPRRWKATGEVTAFAFNTLDEREYVIEDPTCRARGVHEYLRKRVRLIGTVVGNRLVRITQISVLDSPETPGGRTTEGDAE